MSAASDVYKRQCKVVFVVGDFTTTIGDPTGKNKARPEISREKIESNMKTYLEQVGKILLTDEKSFSWVPNSDWFTSVTDINLPADSKIGFQVVHDGVKITTPVDPNTIVGKAIVFENTRKQVSEQTSVLRRQISVVTLTSFLWTLRHITHAQLIKRDMFQDRLAKNEDLYMHEMMYPVLQGIDSSVITTLYGSCDMEIGGTDQTFNMLMGRQIQEINKINYETAGVSSDLQAVVTMDILSGTDGVEKMSKSLDNYISIADEANDMYGKVLSIPDALIVQYFRLCTYMPMAEIEEVARDLEHGAKNPKDIKMRLAREIVAMYHGQEKALMAEAAFTNTFKHGEVPHDAAEVVITAGEKLIDVLLREHVVPSKTEFRRLIKEGAISVVETAEKIDTPDFVITKSANFRIGKRRFIKIVLK
ncbi:TPA: tyrosine--tRNA ligase [Candidatus Taylorbacteria bacterium]|nr:tyrosine--tRNA ligase [Candidatus Taylorbacteria bacterium]